MGSVRGSLQDGTKLCVRMKKKTQLRTPELRRSLLPLLVRQLGKLESWTGETASACRCCTC